MIKRNKLWTALRQKGIKEKLNSAIMGMYSWVEACVKTNTGFTDYFNCPEGIKQGCLVSPILFLLFIGELVKYIDESGVRGIQLFLDLTEILSLLFADDLALTADTVIGLKNF